MRPFDRNKINKNWSVKIAKENGITCYVKLPKKDCKTSMFMKTIVNSNECLVKLPSNSLARRINIKTTNGVTIR